MNYVTGVAKGQTPRGKHLNGVFTLGAMDEDRVNYTGQAVVETANSFVSGTTKVAWTPVIPGTIDLLDANGASVVPEGATVTAAKDGTITVTGGALTDTVAKIKYAYDNAYIPANEIPTVRAELKTIPLTAKVRRIAVHYSNLAAFQAKTDYGFDMGAELAAQAVAELQYEVDSEGIALLDTAAEEDASLVWSKTLPVGVSKREHYQGFLEIVELAKKVIYDRTRKFTPNIIIASSDIMPVLTFIDAFKAAPTTNIVGPYFAGTLGSMKVYVSPMLNNGRFIVECKGNDMATAPAVYAPYMPIIPTQLLEFADGGTSRGWSTMYDMQILSKTLDAQGNETQYSPLLVAGRITA